MVSCKATASGSTQRKQRSLTGVNRAAWSPPMLIELCTTARRATNEDKKSLIDSVDCFIFDCDGELGTCDSWYLLYCNSSTFIHLARSCVMFLNQV